MGITFNANEIFEMAEQIERNGARFYRKAAEGTADKQMKKMLLDMAVMEDGHLKTFEEMKKDLSDREKEPMVFDPNNEAALYLQEMADASGYEGKITPTKELTGKETMKDILEIALNAEKESVIFYYGLRGMVPVKAGKAKIELIINEELVHITILLKQLKNLLKAE